MKDEYKKENPDVNLMGDKFIKPSKKKLENTPKSRFDTDQRETGIDITIT